MSDGIANHPKNSRAPVQFMGSIEILQFVKRHLTRSGRRGNRRVRQRAAFSQRKNTAGETHLTHGNRDAVLGMPSPLKQAHAVCNGSGLRGDLDCVHLTMQREMDRPSQFRSSLEVVYREHDTGWDGVLPGRLAGQLPESLHLDVAPLASSFAGLDQPIQLSVDVPGETAARPFAATCCQKGGARRPMMPKPAQELRSFGVAGEPVEAQFHGWGLAQCCPDGSGHIGSGCHRDDPTNAPHTGAQPRHRCPRARKAGLKTGTYICRLAILLKTGRIANRARPYQKCKAPLPISLTHLGLLVTFDEHVPARPSVRVAVSKEHCNARETSYLVCFDPRQRGRLLGADRSGSGYWPNWTAGLQQCVLFRFCQRPQSS